MTKIKPPLGPLMIICTDIGRKILDLYCLCFTILHLLLNKVGQLHLFSRCQRILTLLIRFEPLSEPLMKKIVGSNNFSAQFIKIISHYKKIGYNINVLQQTACLVVNPITVGNFAFLFNCTPVGRTSDSMMVPT